MGWGTGNLGGGSGGLNFKVVGYATEAELLADTPKENTIGIITTNKITGWLFSATEPESPAEGMVWISTGSSSDIAFNALKKNGIMVYPLSAKQYVTGAWVDVTAMSYQGGEWVEWIRDLYIFDNGQIIPWEAYSQNSESCTISDTGIVFTDVINYRGAYTTEKVDLTDYGKVIAIGNITDIINTDSFNKPRLIVTSTPVTNVPGTGVACSYFTSTGEITVELDVSSISGSYYVEIWGSCVGEFTKVFLKQMIEVT